MTASAFLAALAAAAGTLPWALGSRSRPPEPARSRRIDRAVIVDLAAASLASGAAILDILDAVGHACEEEELCVCATALRLGVDWDDAWAGVPARLEALERALAPAWRDGIAPAPLLRAQASRIRHSRTQEAKEAAERLAVSLVLPLGLCLLPAFVLIGLVPVVIDMI